MYELHPRHQFDAHARDEPSLIDDGDNGGCQIAGVNDGGRRIADGDGVRNDQCVPYMVHDVSCLYDTNVRLFKTFVCQVSGE